MTNSSRGALKQGIKSHSMWSARYTLIQESSRSHVGGIFKICGTFFPTPVFYGSIWLKIHYLLQKTHPSGFCSQKSTQNSQLKNLGQNDQKLKNGLKSYFSLIDCLETWSDCSLQEFCLLKAVKARKRV